MLAPVRILCVYMFRRLTVRMNSPYFTDSTAVFDTSATERMGKSAINKGGIRRLRSRMAQGLKSEDDPPKVKAEVHEQSISLQTHAQPPTGQMNCTGRDKTILNNAILHILYRYSCIFYFFTETLSNCKKTTTKVKEETVDNQALLTSSRKTRRGRLKVEYEEEGAELKREPCDWRTQLSFIREMRSKRDAPVDQMGAEKCYDTEAPSEVSENQSQTTGGNRQPISFLSSFLRCVVTRCWSP